MATRRRAIDPTTRLAGVPGAVRVALCAVVLSVVACGGSYGDDGGPDPDDPDAAAAACSPTLEIGHCIDGATDEPCLDFEAAAREFIPIGDGVVVPGIIGPQGAEMYVLAVRAEGIDPGTVENPPRADVSVLFEGEERGRFTAFPSFFPDSTVTGAFVAPQLFTVVFQAAALEGETIDVLGEVTNPGDGDQFCAESRFVGGAIIDPME